MFTRNILLLVVFLSFLVCFCCSTDTITFNQPLKDGDLLISNAKSFALGFFSPESSAGSKRYVGIWYQQIPGKTVVWVANRDSPVNGESGILSIDNTGNLVIQDKNTKTSVWKTNHTSPATGTKAYSAQLLETGNLVLYHDQDRTAATWQSFDYPTNTLLPFMKLGQDKKTGLNRILQSWKSSDDPSMGQYVLDLEFNGAAQVYLKRSWGQIWRSGPWNGVGLSGVPEMSQDGGINLNYAENEDEVTITYSLRDPSVHSMFVLNESGTVNRLTWQGYDKGWAISWTAPQDQCDSYARCGDFSNCNPDGSCSCLTGFQPLSKEEWKGCGRNTADVCRNGEGFLKMTGVKIPDTQTAVVNRKIGLKECENLCLKNCSCNGYASANVSDGGMGCFIWYGDLKDTREVTNGGQDMYLRVSASDLAELKKKSKRHTVKIVEITLAILVAAVALLVCCLILKIRKNKRQKINTRELNTCSESYEGSSSMGVFVDETGSTDVSIFDLKTIQFATQNFSADNKLGQGGFGSVYKGKLPNEQLVAVKRLSRSSGQGIEEFKNEVTLIARLQHRNLVRLLGCCFEQGEKMLVYEYMPNKALDSFIFDNTKGKSLDWTKRFEIILGIARGLLYLHRDSRLRIIHRDLKASNVLLDASMNPKISDFGMAKIFGADQNEANTNRVVGTYGYMSPEYAMEGHFSVKSDVFSFGVILLEIVSGRKNKSPFRQNSLNLIGDVWDFWSEGMALNIVDPSLGESYDSRKVSRCIHVALLCVQASANVRPTMSEVVFMLCNETKLPHPNQPGFILLKQDNSAAPSSSITGGSQSVNSMTMTEINGR